MPQEQADTVMLCEVDASPEAFEAHWAGPSKQQANRAWEGLKVSASGVRCDIVELENSFQGRAEELSTIFEQLLELSAEQLPLRSRAAGGEEKKCK